MICDEEFLEIPMTGGGECFFLCILRNVLVTWSRKSKELSIPKLLMVRFSEVEFNISLSKKVPEMLGRVSLDSVHINPCYF